MVLQRPGRIPGVVRPGGFFLMGRNFLGYYLITSIMDAGGHLIIRVRAGIRLHLTEGWWLPDGSRPTWTSRTASRVPVIPEP